MSLVILCSMENLISDEINNEEKINKMFAVEFMLKNGDKITIICEGLIFTNLSREDAERDDSNKNLEN